MYAFQVWMGKPQVHFRMTSEGLYPKHEPLKCSVWLHLDLSNSKQSSYRSSP